TPVTSGSRARPGRRTRRRSPGAAGAEAAGPGSAADPAGAAGAVQELSAADPVGAPVRAAAAADLGPARLAVAGADLAEAGPAAACAAPAPAAANPAVPEDGWCRRPAPAPVRARLCAASVPRRRNRR